MDNKVGAFILMFVGIIVALALFGGSGGIAGNVGQVTNLNFATNHQITFPTNTTCATLRGQAVYPDTTATSVTVVNATSNATVNAANYTLRNDVVSNGQLIAQLCGTTTKDNSGYAGSTVNATYAYEPYGYIGEGGGRTMASLIIIFAALSIAGFVLYKFYEDYKDILGM